MQETHMVILRFLFSFPTDFLEVVLEDLDVAFSGMRELHSQDQTSFAREDAVHGLHQELPSLNRSLTQPFLLLSIIS